MKGGRERVKGERGKGGLVAKVADTYSVKQNS